MVPRRINILVLVLALAFNAFNVSNAQTFFVSPAGNDRHPGTESLPLRSFSGAVDKVRAVLDGSGDVTVYFREGIYLFDQTVILGPGDDGTANQEITYAAFPGEKPVFSSLVQVKGWTKHKGNIMRASLPSQINHVRYLQDRSENWLNRSTLPYFSTREKAGGNRGCLECNLGEEELQEDFSNIQYPPDFDAPDWSMATQYDLRHASLMWHQEILPILKVDPEQRRLFTTVPSCYQMRADREEVPPRTYVVNTLEGITSPGDWACLNGYIYLYPVGGTDDIFVPQLTELIRLDDGTSDGNIPISSPVQHITFDGITFTGGDFRSLQTGDVAVQHDWMVVDQPDALLRIRNAANITVQNCTFTKSGGSGIRVDRYGQHIKIVNNTISYLGRNGIGLIGRGPGYGDVNKNNEIADNYIERTGMEKWTAISVVIDQSSNNHIHHNYFANTYFTALAIIGPRQQAFEMNAEGMRYFYRGREFHFHEFSSEAIQAAISDSEEAMAHIYNYGNLIEENAFIDVDEGKGHFLNGKAAYMSGFQKNRKNSFQYNYIYDSFDHSSNDYAWYNDMDQDACDVIGNMVNGVQSAGNQPEPAPLIVCFGGWAESDGHANGSTVLLANVSINCSYCNNEECSHTVGNFIEKGAIKNGKGGEADFLEYYIRSYGAIAPGNIAGRVPPGSAEMRKFLAEKMISFGAVDW
jgi:hypothetical protein